MVLSFVYLVFVALLRLPLRSRRVEVKDIELLVLQERHSAGLSRRCLRLVHRQWSREMAPPRRVDA
jgi:hypothetical protein